MVKHYKSLIYNKLHGEWVNLLAESPYALQMAMEKYPDIEFHFTSEF